MGPREIGANQGSSANLAVACIKSASWRFRTDSAGNSVNRVEAAFFSFTPPAPAGDDGSYLRWHLLDHMPEQFQLAGMVLTMARDLGSLGIRALAIAPSLFHTGITQGIPDEFANALTKDAAFPKRMGRPEEYGKLVCAIVENPMLNGGCIRLDAGQRFAPK